MATHSVFLPEELHGPRSLAGYSPWDCKESDTTERLSLHFSGRWKRRGGMGQESSQRHKLPKDIMYNMINITNIAICCI